MPPRGVPLLAVPRVVAGRTPLGRRNSASFPFVASILSVSNDFVFNVHVLLYFFVDRHFH